MTIHLPTPQVSIVRNAATMEDVLDYVLAFPRYAMATRIDYAAAIKRCVSLYNANRLSDVSANLEAFQHRWPSDGFDPLWFKSRGAYSAWRRKMRAALREFHGEAAAGRERRARDDDWTILLAATEMALVETGMGITSMIPVKKLADTARRAELAPTELKTSIVAQWAEAAAPSRRRSLVRAVQTLEALRASAGIPVDLLPAAPLEDIEKVRRAARPVLPSHLAGQVEEWIARRCDGEVDFVTEEAVNAASAQTWAGYRAALLKYIHTAIAVKAVPSSIPCLGHAMTQDVLRSVLRSWIGEEDPRHRISERTMHRYIRNIRTLMELQGLDTRSFVMALKTSRSLQKGNRDNKEMPLATRKFCALLVQHREYEIRFRSLHRSFQRMAQGLMAEEGRSRQAIQLGTLAAFAAIELWGVPLRLENALALRIRGERPTLVLPHGKRDYAMLVIPGQEVKNGKRVHARISRNRARALEVIEWFMKEIRPAFPKAETSELLIPGWEADELSHAGFRNWLKQHSADAGLPMTPHNFRHGQASLYLKHHLGEYSGAARLLGDKTEAVRTYYAWIDDDAEMARVQRLIAQKAELL
ncbi:hypothetical protein [Alterinioella nitratireducens]|uniref:hypothetical protein n=1 Tax=Rhodobacterales TaxID=204455 RepID=UPI0040599571